jgi:DNA-binding ferritin-like protein (Dps family)
MAARWIEKLTGPLDEKKRWRQYKARQRRLPANYRTAVEGIERYLMYFGRGEAGLTSMYEDLIDLFEQSAAAGTPIRDIVGEDPVEFVETFVQNYPDGQWRIREQNRLKKTIADAAGEDERPV